MPRLQKWEDRTVRLLIENYVHFKHLFKKGKTTKKDVFQKIADRFNEISTVKVSGDQCMRKWLKLEAKFKEIEDNNNLTGRAKKSWKFYEDLEEAIGDSPKVNPAYTYDFVDGKPPLSLNVHNSESDEDSDAEDDEIGSTEKRVKTLNSRARKRKSHSSAAEMLSFLHSYTEKKEKVEEEKLNLLREMKQEKKEFLRQFLDVLKTK